MPRRENFRYAGCSSLACPVCAEAGKWRMLSKLVRRELVRGDIQLRHVPFITETNERLFGDDEEVTRRVRLSDVETRTTTRYRHKMTLMCDGMGVHAPKLFHESSAVRHTFSEDELPSDYWHEVLPVGMEPDETKARALALFNASWGGTR